MARPTGWDILGLDGDPAPGVVESVQALAKEFGDFAHDVEAAYRSLNSFGSDTTALQWVGQTADAFKSNFGPLPGRLQKLYTSYSEASDALSAYAPALQAAQSKADAALRQAQDANADLQRATTNANSAAADLKTAQQNHAASPNPQAVTDAQTAHDTAQTNLTNAKATMAALTKQANDAFHDRITAALACARALGHAQSDGIHNKHWWEHLGADLAEWGGKIAEIANDLAPILDVLALATSWIPGVDVITAALAEADNLIALAGTGLQIAGDAMQGHWGDALMGAGMLGLTFLGGKAIEKVGGKLMDKFGGKLLEKFGQKAEGNIGCFSKGDPVDVVSGQMIMSELDLGLPGVLSLELNRSYASDYEYGRLFGPGWSSTLDQRISINAAGIHFVGDDAQTLHYPLPDGDSPVLPAEGLRWPLVWERDTDEIRVCDPATGRTRHFAVVHHSVDDAQIRDLTAISDRNGNRIVVHRTVDGTPTAVTLPGYRLAIDTVAAADGPRLSGIRLLDGQGSSILRTFAYDHRGLLAAVTDASGQPYVYDYDDQDRLTSWTDRVGYRYAYEYGADSRVARGVGLGGYLSATFQYDLETRVTRVTDSLGHVTEFHYDEHGHIARVVDALGGVVAMEYDRFGHLVARTDELGRTTSFLLDEYGDIARLTSPDGSVAEFGYNELRQLTSVREGDTVRSLYTFDERGNLLASADATGAVSRFEYDEHGHCVGAWDAAGAAHRFVNDAAGLIVEAVDPLGRSSRIERDAFGAMTAAIGPLGRRSEMRRGLDGRLEARLLPDGATEAWEYDAEGRLVAERDATGAVSRFEFGPFGLMRARTLPDGERHEFGYDTELRLTSVTGPDGRVWSYEHDPAGRLVAETDFDGRRLTYRHDAAGQLVAKTAGGMETRFAYTPNAALAAWETADGRTTIEYGAIADLPMRITGPDAVIEYARDPVGRVLAETVDGRTVSSEYDAAGRRTRRTTPGGLVSTWTYDQGGLPVQLESTAGSVRFAYDAAGREVDRQLGALSLTQSWDVSDRLTGQLLAASGPGDRPDAQRTAQRRTYGYRSDSTLETVTDLLHGDRRFELSPGGRVTRVEARNWTQTYAYDGLGNITRSDNSAVADDPVGGDRAYSGMLVRSAGRRSYEYDERGRVTLVRTRTLSGQRRERRYEWDAEDRLARVTLPDGTVWAYRYDPLGRRIAKQRLGADGRTVAEEVRFAWDDTQLAEQSSTGTDGRTRTVTWDWEPGTWQVVAQTESYGRRTAPDAERIPEADQDSGELDRQFFAVVADLVGAPSELVDAAGRVLPVSPTDLWGRRTLTDMPERCPLGFPGQYHDDETGLDYNYARYYDPETGRYLSGDPLGLEPSPNPYAYVANPTAWTDPLGLASTKGPQWNKDGGNYNDMRPSNPPGTPVGTFERNHIPAKDAWIKLGITDSLPWKYGPSIRMDLADHKAFISTGSGAKSVAWRAKQGWLIKQGKWDVAMAMDIGKIRSQFGTKYDGAIAEMVADLPNNDRLQKMLTSNGWKIRTCLLK
ncbi:RHS repeat-associated protein [Catenulispora sp. EB89]|uniref:RHS repeat-associated core domain-containing protein n=1 Tax=Catenulispora sp. EB89 TaxID=3156257 RepID=UPI0035149A3F